MKIGTLTIAEWALIAVLAMAIGPVAVYIAAKMAVMGYLSGREAFRRRHREQKDRNNH